MEIKGIIPVFSKVNSRTKYSAQGLMEVSSFATMMILGSTLKRKASRVLAFMVHCLFHFIYK